jgi:hypothetical protein
VVRIISKMTEGCSDAGKEGKNGGENLEDVANSCVDQRTTGTARSVVGTLTYRY